MGDFLMHFFAGFGGLCLLGMCVAGVVEWRRHVRVPEPVRVEVVTMDAEEWRWARPKHLTATVSADVGGETVLREFRSECGSFWHDTADGSDDRDIEDALCRYAKLWTDRHRAEHREDWS